MNGRGPLTPADLRGWMAGPWRIGTRHPASALVRDLIPAWPDTTVTCPHCAVDGKAVFVLDHLLGEHDSGLQHAAEWLETVDADLFSLAVHRLAFEARNQPDEGQFQASTARISSQ
jgi:hypothetical protein